MIRVARHREILSLIEKKGIVSIAELAKRFDTAPITIRRDLLELESQGHVIRTHGGATAINIDGEPVPYQERERVHAREKALIGKKAAELVSDGESIILNAGTTMHELALQLRQRKDLQIVTNGLTVATELASTPGAQILMVGGVIDAKKLGTVGPSAEQMLKDIHVAKAFLGVTGISVGNGIFMHSAMEAQINAAFIRCAREVIVVADSSKFGVTPLFRIAPLSEVDKIVTDNRVRPDIVKSLEQMKIDVLIA